MPWPQAQLRRRPVHASRHEESACGRLLQGQVQLLRLIHEACCCCGGSAFCCCLPKRQVRRLLLTPEAFYCDFLLQEQGDGCC